MRFSLIVAIDNKHGFAKNNRIPWYFKEDFVHFRNTTKNHPCVMGRNTYEEINEKLGDKAKDSVLPNRQCFVVSTTLTSLPNATVVSSLDEIKNYLPIDTTVFIIGGKRLFDEGMKIAQNVIITEINNDYDCDVFFDYDYITTNFRVINKQKSNLINELTFMYFSRNEKHANEQTTS